MSCAIFLRQCGLFLIFGYSLLLLAACNGASSPDTHGVSAPALTVSDDTYLVGKDTSNNELTVLNNDSGTDIQIVSVSNSSQNATISHNGEIISYSPSSGTSNVTDSFSYTIQDASGAEATAKVSVEIVDDIPPTATDDSLTINMNSPLNQVDVLANDSDPDGSISISNVDSESAQGGRVKLNDSGDQVIYQPPINYSGGDSFEYQITDGITTVSATVNITINQHIPGTRPCELEAGTRIGEARPYCFDVLIPAADGHNIGATVFVPADAGASKPPIALHAHGFGESRFADLENPNAFMLHRVTAQSLLELWHEGYWVVSYDQRGFGAHLMWGATTESAFTSGETTCVQPTDPNCIDVMNPEREGRDVADVVDWLVANLRDGFSVTAANGGTTFNAPASGTAPLYAEDATDDPTLGTIGLSYGGGFQTIGSNVDAVLNGGDTRINTMIPVTTWFDLRYSLNTNDVPKSGWIEFLTVATSLGTITPSPTGFLAGVGAEAGTDMVSAESMQGLYARSVRSYCENQGDDTFHIDADLEPAAGTGTLPGNVPSVFMIQGQRDILFNYNEAVDLARCYENAGSPDVRLLVQTEGHILPAAQPASYKGDDQIIYIDELIYCDTAGNNPLSTRELISGWFREKLGVVDNSVTPLNADAMPNVCTTHFTAQSAPLSGNSFADLDSVPTGDTSGNFSFDLDGDPAQAGNQDISFQVPGLPGNVLFEQTLFTASEQRVISGIPLLEMDIAASGTPDVGGLVSDARFFVTLGVRRGGSGEVERFADQTTPVSGPPGELSATNCTVELAPPFFSGCVSEFSYPRNTGLYPEQVGETIGRIAGFAAKLEANDEVVLQITGGEELYNGHNTTRGLYNITLSGSIQIPVVTAP